MLGNCPCFCCRLLIFFKINFFTTLSADPDQDQHYFVRPAVGSNCLQSLSAEDKSRMLKLCHLLCLYGIEEISYNYVTKDQIL